MENRLRRFKSIFPFYIGFSADLLFFIAIDTLFLAGPKHLSASQIVSLTTVSLVSCIILQMPILAIIRKIGNTASVKIGTFLILVSAVLITFGPNFYVIALGKIVSQIAFAFRNMINVILKNNLEILGEENQYIKFRTRGMSVYSAITMLISFVASFMFNLDPYLPMYACILCCVISCVLSLFMNEEINKNKPEVIEESVKINSFKVIKKDAFLLLIFITFSLGYSVVSSGQTESKLFIQETLFKYFNSEKVSILIGIMVCISRIVRLFSNIFFNKIYSVCKKHIIFYLSLILFISMALLIIAYYLPIDIMIKFALMVFSYIIILFMRDPFQSCIQELMLKNCGKEAQQVVFSVSDFCFKIVYAIMSFLFSILLLKYDLIIIIIICAILSIIGSFLSYVLCRIANKKNLYFDKEKLL